MADAGDARFGDYEADSGAALEHGTAQRVGISPDSVADEPLARVASEKDLNPETQVDYDYVREHDGVEVEEVEKRFSSSSSSNDPKRAPLNRLQSTATTATTASSMDMSRTESQAGPPPKRKWSNWLLLKHRVTPPIPRERSVTPEYQANFFSKMFFQWITPVMTTGYQRPLEYHDIPLINPNRSATVLSERLERSFQARVDRGGKRPLLGAMYDTFYKGFYIGAVCQLISSVLQVINPFILRYLITFSGEAYYAAQFHTPAPPIGRGIGLVVAITCIQIIQNMCTNQFFYHGMLNGGQARAVLISLVFDKSLKISGRARAGGKLQNDLSEDTPLEKPAPGSKAEKAWFRKALPKQTTKQKKKKPEMDMNAKRQTGLGDGQGYSNGRIINLMSTDTYRVDQASGMLHLIWTAPISIIVTLILLLINLKASALAGFGLLVIAMPLLGKSIKSLINRRKGVNKLTDQRVGLTQEVLHAVRFIKYFGWETSFLKRLSNIRSQEIRSIQFILAIRNGINAISMSLPVFASMLAFIAYAYTHTGADFNPALIFSSLALFNSIRLPLNMLPLVLGQVTDAVNSITRIQDFLLAEDEKDEATWDYDNKNAVHVDNAAFTWEKAVERSKEDAVDASKDAKQIKADQKAAKKAKRHSKRASKSEDTGKRMSKSAIQSGDSIFKLKDLSFKVGRNELIAVIGGVGSGKTSLLAALAGDMRKTAGEVTLGATRAFCPQSAWIQNATVKDNILFGKDMKRRWYNEVIDACALRPDLEMLPGGDLTEIGEKGITVSGGQKQRLNIARAIYYDSDLVLLDDPLSAVDAHVGRHIMDHAICGLLDNKCRILATHQLWVLNRVDRIIWIDEGHIQAFDTYDNLMAHNEEFRELIANNAEEEKKRKDPEEEDEVEGEKKDAKKRTGKKPKGTLMQAEERATSSVSWNVYSSYIKASGSILVLPFVLILLVLSQGGNITTSLWLSWWTSNKFGYSTGVYVGVYAALGFFQALLMFLFSVALSIAGTQASKVMLQRAITRVLRAPMSFFDTTPLGRITNRFSKDIDTMDNTLTDNMRFL